MGETAFFDALADQWDDLNQYPMEKIDNMLDMIGIGQGDTVLDAGTGTGVLLPLLARRTAAENITAIDISPGMIARAREKFSGLNSGTNGGAVSFITADILTYPFGDGIFNHVICYSVFPHFEDKRAIIAKLSAALVPGGLLSVLHSSSRARINGTHAHIRSHRINSDYLLPAREYIPLLNRCGLREENIIDNDEMFILCARKK